MKVEKYELESVGEFAIFEFVSEGPKGMIRKRIEFQKTYDPLIFNLAFGDKNPITGEIDDTVVSNNGDSEKVLATVVDAVYLFLDSYPNAAIYATGSTPARTRLYRMGITRNFDQMRKDFLVFGQIGNEFYSFEIGVAYECYLAHRKFN